jgi:uncharacterized small protein (DUF1192 family)
MRIRLSRSCNRPYPGVEIGRCVTNGHEEAVMFEDLEPRAARGAPLVALTREDLDGYSVEDLQQRIAGLQAEIERSRAAIEGKSSQRNAADAMFNFRS